MVNGTYAAGREEWLSGNVAFLASNIALVLIDEDDDAPNLATDAALDDIAGAARVSTSGNLASKTNVGGTIDAADIVLSSVSGDECESFTIFENSGVESTSTLLINFDTATGLPVTPNGTNITITWNASGIMAWSDA